ncbi:MAG: branched-chain amino acid ABC transporter permease [Gammaproteobacteria bacterium]|nr:MAG: branched-chain amino acid ABC transporter permease [Gammaproteobacteria bacterium]
MSSIKKLSGFYILSLLGILLGVFFADNYFVSVVGVIVGFHIILAVSLNLLMGYSGQISLGHAAFFGLGAYISAIVPDKFNINPWIGILTAMIIVGLLAYIISKPILKLKGHYLAMATLGFGVIVYIFLVQTVSLTGGPDGMGDIATLYIGSYAIDSDVKWYFVVLFFALLVVWLSLNLINSRAGRAMRAVAGSEYAAEMMGVDTSQTKTKVFVISAVFCAGAGGLFAFQQGFLSPDSFSFFFSIELVTMVVLGGMASTYGAIFGAIILTLLPEFLVVFEDYEMLIFGGILIFMMIFMPKGLFVTLADKINSK